MKLGDVMRKERQRCKLTAEFVANQLGMTLEQYEQVEAGNSTTETSGPTLARIATILKVPTSRLIATTGKFIEARSHPHQSGKLIKEFREKRGLSAEELARQLEISLSELESIEAGRSPIEEDAPILLGFSEIAGLPIYNLFYPRGLRFDQLVDYP